MSYLERYERYGWDYDRRQGSRDLELAWHLAHARETGGPVLELACGTGPLLGPIAELGLDVVGIDLSDRMLDLARLRVAELPAEVRGRIALLRRDMSRFDLERTFALVIISDNSFREVESMADLHAVLACVHRHLTPGGRLLLSERRFDPSLYPDGVRELPWSEPIAHPVTGDSVRRRVTVRHDAAARRIRGEMRYRSEGPDGAAREETFVFESPVFTPDDYRTLLASAGFSSRLHVGYEEREDDGLDPVLCFVAEAGPAQSPSNQAP